ncbi:MAG: hypothetical protein ACQ9MH_21345, partial [Nitrospinales bacterium]
RRSRRLYGWLQYAQVTIFASPDIFGFKSVSLYTFPITSRLKDHQRLIFQVGHCALPTFDLSAPFFGVIQQFGFGRFQFFNDLFQSKFSGLNFDHHHTE